MATIAYKASTLDGTRALPAYTFDSDPDTGWYLASAGNARLSIGDADVITCAGIDVTVAGDLVVSGAGPHAFGAAVENFTSFLINQTFTSGGASSVARVMAIHGTLTAATGDTTRHTIIDIATTGGITTQGATETITDVATILVAEPGITVGTGDTVTNASTIKIVNAPTEGTNNRAFWVASGASEFDGSVRMDSTVGIGVAGSANADLVLEAGRLMMKESATPTADTNYGKVYTKTDNKLYFQDGAGAEHEVAFV